MKKIFSVLSLFLATTTWAWAEVRRLMGRGVCRWRD